MRPGTEYVRPSWRRLQTTSPSPKSDGTFTVNTPQWRRSPSGTGRKWVGCTPS